MHFSTEEKIDLMAPVKFNGELTTRTAFTTTTSTTSKVLCFKTYFKISREKNIFFSFKQHPRPQQALQQQLRQQPQQLPQQLVQRPQPQRRGSCMSEN